MTSTRRDVLLTALAQAGLVTSPSVMAKSASTIEVPNVTGLYTVRVERVVSPATTEAVARWVHDWPGQVAAGGGRYSMGGQVAVQGGLHLDMRGMNQLVWLRPELLAVRIQAGMRWRDLQDQLDPHDLAVKTMQSYANFTVGGSVSVNAHGRYVGHGPMGHTVRALQLVLADGSVVEASRTQHPELFSAAIGGYGAVGVITEVELDLARNVRIERRVEHMPLERYHDFFSTTVLADSTALMHNADLVPPSFDAPISITWRRVADDVSLTERQRLTPRNASYAMEQNAIWWMTEVPAGHRLRTSVLQPMWLTRKAVKYLNHEASLDVAELEPRTRAMSTYALQEYFIPERNFLPFARQLAAVLARRRAHVLNVSIRHSPRDEVSLLRWAPEPVYSFVVFYKQRTWPSARDEVGRWTRELINLTLAHGGRYYLPYQLHATQRQFDMAYPEASRLREAKRRADPQGKFSNELWRRYL